MKKFKKNLRDGLLIFVCMICFLGVTQMPLHIFILRLLPFTIVGLATLFIHLVIHEAGHLIAGKLSGYSFVFFKIGSITFIEEDGKITRKKYGIPGIGGQCLMSPPDVSDENYNFPFVFYNAGGSLANFLLGCAFLPIIFLTMSSILQVFFYVFAIFGLVLGFSNIVPMNINGISNDGLNMRNCRKSAKSRRALWIQLKYAALATQGTRVKDMPQEWFAEFGEITDALTGFLAALKYDYFLDSGEHEKARDYARATLENPGELLEIHKAELRCALLFHELTNECRSDEIEKLYTAELQKYIKATASNLSKKRLMYAYNLLCLKDERKAEMSLADFEKACNHTPFKGEIAGEKELVDYAHSRRI